MTSQRTYSLHSNMADGEGRPQEDIRAPSSSKLQGQGFKEPTVEDKVKRSLKSMASAVTVPVRESVFNSVIVGRALKCTTPHCAELKRTNRLSFRAFFIVQRSHPPPRHLLIDLFILGDLCPSVCHSAVKAGLDCVTGLLHHTIESACAVCVCAYCVLVAFDWLMWSKMAATIQAK